VTTAAPTSSYLFLVVELLERSKCFVALVFVREVTNGGPVGADAVGVEVASPWA